MKKLYRRTAADFRLFDYSTDGVTTNTREAGGIPLITWPDGRWCFEANVFIQTLLEGGASTRTRGGTLFTYSSHIVHLIRYCHAKGIRFIDLTDADFCDFMQIVASEMHKKTGEKVRIDNTSRQIGQTSLRFLDSVAILFDDPNFICPGGRIDLIPTPKSRNRRNTKAAKALGPRSADTWQQWTHRSIPVGGASEQRFPISNALIQKLRNAASTSADDFFVRRRRLIMLTILEITGGRRLEVASLNVEDVLAAESMADPKLRLLTAKRKGGKAAYRMVPISRIDLLSLLEFIRISRSIAVRRTAQGETGRGPLLINSRTSAALSPETISYELALLRTKAGISEKACAHMFRHRRITKYFVKLIKAHKLRNPEHFHRSLVDVEGLKLELQQFAGHLDSTSLDRYIHLAFDEVSDRAESIREARSSMLMDDSARRYAEVKAGIKRGKSTRADVQKLEAILDQLLTERPPSGRATE